MGFKRMELRTEELIKIIYYSQYLLIIYALQGQRYNFILISPNHCGVFFD